MRKYYQFEFNGQTLGEDSYGHGRDDSIKERTYLGDFELIAKTYSTGKTGNILEWGSGITSLMLSDLLNERNFGTLLTIDDNKPYLEAVCAAFSNIQNVTALSIDTIGPRESQADQCLNYSSFPYHFADRFDLIFIDGRRRVECALTAAIISHEETVVVIHDYRRTRYQPMLALFDIVKDGPHFRLLKVKPGLRSIFNLQRHYIKTSMLTNMKPLLHSSTGQEWISVLNIAKGFNLESSMQLEN